MEKVSQPAAHHRLRAGIDDLLADPDLPDHVPVARSAQPGGDAEITEYVILHVLHHHRRMPEHAAAQSRGEWLRLDRVPAGERTVGFMGLGLIARPAAEAVRDLGFRVVIWSRTPKDIPGMESFHGPGQLAAFLARTEILVNLLAVTPETRNILCRRTFDMMQEGAAIINIARGEHLVERDLVAALDSGRLRAATLDVFRTEPLPADDPLWRHPGITIMPHCARRPRAANIIPQVVDNIRRLRAGDPLVQLVDRDAGY